MVRVILDTDLALGAPGSDVDDGLALALALADPGIDLELVTTVSGNTDVESATLLALDLLERLGRSDVPVVRGAAAPLLRPDLARSAPAQLVADLGHRGPAPGYAAAEIAARVVASPGEVVLVAIGPLTNVAAAMSLEPRLATAVREVVVMGGVYLGTTNRLAMPGEFNTWTDPEATAAVLASGARLRLVGLDVTQQVRLAREDAAAMAEGQRPFGRLAGRAALSWIDHLRDTTPGDPRAGDSCALHDPLAVAAVTRPELITWRRARVEVVTGPSVARGVAVADLLTIDDPPEANCEVAVAVDAPAALEHVLARVGAL